MCLSYILQWSDDVVRYCELIFNPEYMQDCSFPDGYKYLLLPKLVHTENSIVVYPFHIYLIDDNQQDSFFRIQTNSPINVFQEQHLQITFSIEDHHLILPYKSDSLLVFIDMNKTSSRRISFNFQILSIDD